MGGFFLSPPSPTTQSTPQEGNKFNAGENSPLEGWQQS